LVVRQPRAQCRRLQCSAVYSRGLALVSRSTRIAMNATDRAFPHLLRLLALAAALGCASAARADDYGDVGALIRSRQFAAAIAKADQYIAAKPRDPQMRFLKGVAQTEAGQTAEAMATFTALNQEYPELAEPYNNLAVLYASQSQFEKARDALDQALKANPNYAVAHENLGDVYAKLASISYARAQQLDATNTTVPPKLALIRQLLPPKAPAAATPAPAPAAASAPRS
jgi:tetratricopeptide (TPR) repeat protein